MFGEKAKEKNKNGAEVSVWQTEKYKEARAKAIEIIQQFNGIITEGDFWILKNEYGNGGLMYSGLIMSHNGCLKLNDTLPPELQFKPSCMSVKEDGYKQSLVYTYINDAQGVYEVGEVSDKNCKNAYPYAMALKRCIDRVVLKNSKIAYAGIYSEVEADEFKKPATEEDFTEELAQQEQEHNESQKRQDLMQEAKALCQQLGINGKELTARYALKGSESVHDWQRIVNDLKGELA